MSSPSNNLEVENITNIKKKIVAFDKLLKYKAKVESECQELRSNGAGKDFQINRLQNEVGSLKQDLEEKMAKIEQQQRELQQKSQQIKLLDHSLIQKRRDLITQEVEVNALKREVEDLKMERESVNERLKNDSQVKAIREEYEREKWEHLATISGLKQTNASLEERLETTNEILRALQAEVKELETAKHEADQARSDGAKKDRLIASLTRKLSKMSTGLGKGEGKRASLSFSDLDISESSLSRTFTAVALPPDHQRRFVIFNAKRSLAQKRHRSRIRFRKLGPLEISDGVQLPLCRRPVITDALATVVTSSSKSPAAETVMMPWTDQDMEELPAENDGKRKRNFGTPTSPRKRQKLPATPSLNSGALPVPVDLISPLSCSTPEYSVTRTPDTSVRPPSPSPVSMEVRRQVSPKKDLMTRFTNVVGPSEESSAVKAPPKLQSTVESKEVFFNPNPAKVRQAHRDTAPAIGVPVFTGISKTAPPKASTKKCAAGPGGDSKAAAPSPRLDTDMTDILPIGKNDVGPSITAARKKILQEGLPIETPSAVGKKLTPAQLEAAKNRMVGRAPPGVAARPSVDGFRSSQTITDKQRIHNNSDGLLVGKRKAKVSEADLACPARRKTMPVRQLVAKAAPATSDLPTPPNADDQPSREPETVELILTPCYAPTSTSQSLDDKAERSVAETATATASPVPEVKTENNFLGTSTDEKHAYHRKVKNNAGDESKNAPAPDADSLTAVVKENRSVSLDSDLELSDEEADGPNEVGAGKESHDLETVMSLPSPPQRLQSSMFSESDEEVVSDEERSHKRRQSNPSRCEEIKRPGIMDSDQVLPGPQSGEADSQGKLAKELLPSSPSKIELSRRKFISFLDELLQSFDAEQKVTLKLLEEKKAALKQERQGYAFQAFSDALKINMKHLMGCQNRQSFEAIVASFGVVQSVATRAAICDYIYSVFEAEHRDTPLLSSMSQELPPITRKQQRYFTLLTRLEDSPRLRGIMREMLQLLYYGFLSSERLYHMRLSSVLSLGRLFALCARYLDELELGKKFLVDIFFFKSPRCHLLVTVFMDLWPEVFQLQQSEISPLQETLTWLIFSTGDTRNKEMNVQETRDQLTMRYGFKQGDFNAEKLVAKYILLAEKHESSPRLRADIRLCLLMIGRGKDFRWVHTKLVSRLLKSLSTAMTDDQSDQWLLRWVMETLGMLSRLYPQEGRESIAALFDPIMRILQDATHLDAATEASCITAMLLLGNHLQVQVAKFLASWRPRHQLHPLTKKHLQDFVGTRGRKYAVITNYVTRQEQVQKRKQAGIGPRGGRGRGRGRATAQHFTLK